MTNTLITVKGGSFGYAKKAVLKSMDAHFASNEIHCIFGRNGSGKTTLLKSIAGLLPTINGTIEIGGKSLNELSANELSKLISVVLTNAPKVSGMTVLDFVKFGRYPYSNWLGVEEKGDVEKVQMAISDCKLTDYVENQITELSDGEFQKVQIARALAQDCPLLLLDEPVAHLDLVNKAEIFNILKKTSKLGKTVLFTSHDIQFSLQLATQFTVINNDRIMQMDENDFKSNKVFNQVLSSEGLEINSESNSVSFKEIK